MPPCAKRHAFNGSAIRHRFFNAIRDNGIDEGVVLMAVLRTPEELTEKLKVGRLGFHQGKGRWQVYTKEDGGLVTYYVARSLEPLVEKLATEKGEELRKPLRGSKAPTKADKSDRAAAKATRKAVKDARKPIVEKEIEDSAWFHNLIHDVGKHVYHSVTTHVRLDAEDLNEYEKARAKILKYYSTLEELKGDALRMLDTQAENAELEYALKRALTHIDKLSRFIQVVTASMDKESRIRALTAFVLSPNVVFKEAAS